MTDVLLDVSTIEEKVSKTQIQNLDKQKQTQNPSEHAGASPSIDKTQAKNLNEQQTQTQYPSSHDGANKTQAKNLEKRPAQKQAQHPCVDSSHDGASSGIRADLGGKFFAPGSQRFQWDPYASPFFPKRRQYPCVDSGRDGAYPGNESDPGGKFSTPGTQRFQWDPYAHRSGIGLVGTVGQAAEGQGGQVDAPQALQGAHGVPCETNP